jgi:hypothetical protein
MKTILITVLLLFTFGFVNAHTINYSMEIKPAGDVVLYYLRLGFLHILPYGYDHLLFILSLFLLSVRLKTILLQATCFTVAHTVTLILTACNYVVVLPSIVEPLIAASIVFVAIENLYIKEVKSFHYIIVFAFGLVHGMGFAGALAEAGLPRNSFYTSLLSFNIGVELGQVAFILLIWFAIGRIIVSKPAYRQRFVVPLSIGIALIAAWWTVERMVNG